MMPTSNNNDDEYNNFPHGGSSPPLPSGQKDVMLYRSETKRMNMDDSMQVLGTPPVNDDDEYEID